MTLHLVDNLTLTTERLTLRPAVAADLVDYRRFYAVSDVLVGNYRGGRSDAEVAGILDRNTTHWADKVFGIFSVRRTGDGAFLGGAGLAHPDDWPSHELTWWLMPDARGTGYATEASRAIIEWAYTVLGWSRVETHMRDGNSAAHALAKRLGGTLDRRVVFPDGVTRDVYLLPRQVSA
ncbi:hypothetical protein A8B78_20845 [Jannaschia sp. EhC01]|nr:hypothetical protein A8B78_20845 [Jannaschia sp. EhC01]